VLKKILEEFLSFDGVVIAALVGRDGFVIEIVQACGKTEIGAIGALCLIPLRFFAQGRESVDMGSLRQIVLEYRNGAIIIVPVTSEEFLTIITDTTEGLGSLAHMIAKTSSRVAAII
jgi:hypothetical protein